MVRADVRPHRTPDTNEPSPLTPSPDPPPLGVGLLPCPLPCRYHPCHMPFVRIPTDHDDDDVGNADPSVRYLGEEYPDAPAEGEGALPTSPAPDEAGLQEAPSDEAYDEATYAS